jgi:diguanylate cyclase (GGDEF)-like protein
LKQPAFDPDLIKLGTEAHLPAASWLWKEGDPGDHVVLLLDGMLEVVHTEPDTEPVVLRTVEAGAVIGELASTDGRARSAGVRCRTACRILRVQGADFRLLLRGRPDILEQLYWTQVERVRSLTRQVVRTHHRAITDTLTKIYNYGFFRERLEIEMHRARQTGDPLALIMLDIDHFKHYNDRNGHQEGNAVLVQVASLLKNVGRRGDIVARYGGEEFVALLYGANLEEATRFAENARKAVEEHPFAGAERQPGGRLTVSAGVAAFPQNATDEDGLVKAADMNLYRAKEQGRNQVVSE